ncbi:hypothetical protein ACFX2K_030709 [Malus domestica]
MGSFPKSMKSAIFFIISSLFLVSATTQEGGFISVVVSRKGLDFTKDLLIEQAVSSIIPLKLPEIKKSIKIPLVGKVHIVLSNILIYNVEIGSSYVETGDSDSGDASIQVEGMEVGVTLALKDQEGTLKLSVLECGCYVKDITIKLDGGASWLYQGLVDAFKGQIISAVEDNISNKVREGIVKLDSLLQSLPKQIALDDIAALNVTFVGNPVLSNSSIEFQINGLFTALDDNSASSLYNKGSLDPVPCNAPAKMVEISLHENVFSSVSLVFYNENYMQRTINKIPDQSLLNTAQWKHIVPQLYKQYPDKDMELNISVSSPPIIRVANNGVDFTVYSDVTIGVVEDDDEVISVACISLEIHASCSPKISRNKLAGIVKLNDITASLKWSEIGNLHMRLVQAILSTILKTVVVPYLNLYLWKGLPLPLPRGFTLKNSEILSTNSRLRIFSDVEFVEG